MTKYKFPIGTATLLVSAISGTSALAGALEQTSQSVQIIFEEGNYVEGSVTTVAASVGGIDVAAQPTGDVAETYAVPGFGLKMDLSDRLSFAVIYDQPFGIDVNYGLSSLLFGGTRGTVDSNALTALARYRLSDNVSVYGGPRFATFEGSATLGGLGVGPLDGYTNVTKRDAGVGVVLGAA